MSINYDSILYNENNENARIKERLSPTTIAYITRLKQHVQNIEIHLYGSITNMKLLLHLKRAIAQHITTSSSLHS